MVSWGLKSLEDQMEAQEAAPPQLLLCVGQNHHSPLPVYCPWFKEGLNLGLACNWYEVSAMAAPVQVCMATQ